MNFAWRHEYDTAAGKTSSDREEKRGGTGARQDFVPLAAQVLQQPMEVDPGASALPCFSPSSEEAGGPGRL
jgi:hypothetical protein